MDLKLEKKGQPAFKIAKTIRSIAGKRPINNAMRSNFAYLSETKAIAQFAMILATK